MDSRNTPQYNSASGGAVSRRHFLRRVGLAGASLVALPVLAACGAEATATPVPATTVPAAGPTITSAPTAIAAATRVAGTAVPPAPIGSPAAGSPPPVPPTPTAIAGIPRAKSGATISGGRYQFVQNQDFHPDHNAFLRAEIEAFCREQGWPLDISYASGFTGTGDLLTALNAAVQAGTPPDAFFHDIGVRQYQFQGVLEPTTDLVEEAIRQKGATYPGYEDTTQFDGEWWGLPFYGRAGGAYVREDWFKEAGLDPLKDTATYAKMRDAAMKITDPAQRRWGWGMTVNRSGDGTTNVQQPLMRFGSVLQDADGQIITFDSPETVAGLQWLKETYSDPRFAQMRPPGLLSWTDPSNNEAFLAGTIGVTDNAGTMYAKAVFDQVPHAADILYIPRPARNSDGKYLDSLAGARLHVIKGTRNRAASADLFRHLISDPVVKQLLVVSPGYVLPPYKNLWGDPLVQNDRNAKAAEPLAFPSDRFSGLRWPGPPSAAVDAIGGGTYYTDMMAEILQGKPIPEVVQDFSRRFVTIFRDFGLKGA